MVDAVLRDATVVSCGDEDYPRRLKEIRRPPVKLFVCGRIPDRQRAVAIVGARAATMSAIGFAESLARDLASAGVLIVSGGALGIDTAAHRGALLGGGETVCVLGSGLGRPYPQRNIGLFGQIRHSGGVVSQFAMDAPPKAGHFVSRNGTIAGLADVVVVVSASERSGALHTARFARQYGREVGAVSGSEGCRLLLCQGAFAVTSAASVLDAINGTPEFLSVAMPEPGSAEAKVLAALNTTPQSIEKIRGDAGVTDPVATRALTFLELEGLALRAPGCRFIRGFCGSEHSQKAEI